MSTRLLNRRLRPVKASGDLRRPPLRSAGPRPSGGCTSGTDTPSSRGRVESERPPTCGTGDRRCPPCESLREARALRYQTLLHGHLPVSLYSALRWPAASHADDARPLCGCTKFRQSAFGDTFVAPPCPCQSVGNAPPAVLVSVSRAACPRSQVNPSSSSRLSANRASTNGVSRSTHLPQKHPIVHEIPSL
jgi:hypothetical protein